jgi:hypothetical protein
MFLAALYMLKLSFEEEDEDDHSPSETSIQISLSLSLEIKIGCNLQTKQCVSQAPPEWLITRASGFI